MKKILFLFFILLSLFSCSSKTKASSSPSDSTDATTETEEPILSYSSVLFLRNENMPILSIKGKLKKGTPIENPVLTIDCNQEEKKESFEAELVIKDNFFEVSFLLSSLSYSDVWYNINFILNKKNADKRIAVDIREIPSSSYYDTLAWKKDDRINYVYAFEEYDSNLKICYRKEDDKKTSFSSMNYEVVKIERNQELHFHLKGYNEHENLKLILQGSTTKVSDVLPKGNFDVSLRVDDILKQKSDPYTIYVSYDLSNQENIVENITSRNLSNHSDLQGVSFKGDIYVFRGYKVGKYIYYSLSFNSDLFSMDTIMLSRENSNINLYFSGSSHYYPEGDYSLHIEGIEDGKDAIILIPRNRIDLYGYISFSMTLNDIPFPVDAETESLGRLSVYHDNTLLNHFWPEKWSHRQDVLGKIGEGGYEYEVVADSQKNYCLKKRKIE